jgi:hypothetical protein
MSTAALIPTTPYGAEPAQTHPMFAVHPSDCPKVVSPQHTAVPSVRSAQACASPALTVENVPVTPVGRWYALPQHDKTPPV